MFCPQLSILTQCGARLHFEHALLIKHLKMLKVKVKFEDFGSGIPQQPILYSTLHEKYLKKIHPCGALILNEGSTIPLRLLTTSGIIQYVCSMTTRSKTVEPHG